MQRFVLSVLGAVSLVCLAAPVWAQDADFYVRRAEKSFDRFDEQGCRSAISDYSKAIELSPNRSDIFHARGEVYSFYGDGKRAIADFSEAIRLAPNNSDHYKARAETYNLLNEYPLAIADYGEAIRLAPNNFELYKARADLHRNHNDFPKAIADYGEAIRLDPNNSEAHEWRGHAYVHQGEYDSAIASFTAAIELMAKEKKEAISMNLAYSSRANAWKKMGRYDKAIADYEQATRVEPGAAWTFADLAWLQATCPDEKGRDGQKAYQNAYKAYQLVEGKHWQYLDVLAAAYAECRDFKHASEWEAKAIAMAKNAVGRTSTPKDIEETTARLELYKQKKPYREEPKKN